ncbi:MAG: zeta toxin family protein [Bacteroidales bacterium]|nr:zeta toxin family protein [Bacteroidales bacterium]
MIKHDKIMKGDIIGMDEQYKKVVRIIVSYLFEKIANKPNRYTITVAGESGCGKSETAKAIAAELEKCGLKTVILGQDHYCYLTPKFNDLKRKEDPEWLGPHVEIKMDLLENNLKAALKGEPEIVKPVIDPAKNSINNVKISLLGVKVIIAEGTYASLLKNVDTKIFIDRNRLDTLEDRKKRNRRNEVNDPFTEQILITEHKIIAGHRLLADIVVTKDFDVLFNE